MPNFPNVHANLENGELHVPKDFSIADNDTLPGKNLNGELEWFPTYWQSPVIAIVDGAAPPPTAEHGDRYILRQMGSTAIGSTVIDSTVLQSTAIDTTIVIDTTVIVDSTAMSTTALDTTAINFPFVASTAVASSAIFSLGVHSQWGDVDLNAIVEYYTLDDKGNTINAWRSVGPQQGYRVHNKADDEIYYFDGVSWQSSGNAVGISDAISLTYAEASALKLSNGLTLGQQYWLTDKNILLRATAANAFTIEGSHTRELKALGYVDLTGGTSGEVAGITVDSVSIMSGAESYDTDLVVTAEKVVTNINAHTSSPNYTARPAGSRIIIFPEDGLGSSVNEFAIAASTTTITTEASEMYQGVDLGTAWFIVHYDFDNDFIHYMKDGNNNEVSIVQGALPQLSGQNPIDLFPWGNPLVIRNIVKDSIFTAYTAESYVFLNQVIDFSILNADAYLGDLQQFVVCSTNELRGRSVINAVQASGIIGDNVMSNNGTIDVSYGSGDIEENTINDGTLSAISFSGNCEGNVITDGSSLIIDGSQGEMYANKVIQFSSIDLTDSFNDFSGNNVQQGAEVTGVGAYGLVNDNFFGKNAIVDFSGFAGTFILGNDIANYSTFTAIGSTGDVRVGGNHVYDSTLDLDAYMGKYVQGNHLYNLATITANGATGNILYNRVNRSEMTLTGFSGAECRDNEVNGRSTITLTNCTGFGFSDNICGKNAVVTAIDTTGAVAIQGNQVYGSSLLLDGLLGARITDNTLFDQSTLNAEGASDVIYGNRLSAGTLLAQNSTGEISRNRIEQASELDAQGYYGATCLSNIVQGGATFITSNNGGSIVSNQIVNASIVDVDSKGFSVLNVHIDTSLQTIKFNANPSESKVFLHRSSYQVDTAIDSSATIDFDQDYIRFAGKLNISNTSELQQISGLEKAPTEFIVRPDSGQVITLIPDNLINIQLPQYDGKVVLDNAYGDFILFRKNDTGLNVIAVDVVSHQLQATPIKQAKLTLTSVQVLSLNSAPIEIVPQPGVGKTIELISASVSLSYNTTAYTGNTTLVLKNQLGDSQAESSILAESGTRFSKMALQSDVSVLMIKENSSLEAFVKNGDPASGDSDITLYVSYRVIDL